MKGIPDAARSLVRLTPLVRSALLGCSLKMESTQRTGSYMLRGAALKLSRLAALDRPAGVVCASAGNQGMALSCAGRALGIPVRSVVPSTAARCKREAISGFGGSLVRHGDSLPEAEKYARRLACMRDALFVSACEDLDVMEGDGGWLGREILSQQPSTETIVVPMGSGGLAAGLATELAETGIRIIGVQPAIHSAMTASLAEDRALTDFTGPAGLCEELEGGVGWRSFRTVKQYVQQIVLVPESDVLAAVAFAFQKLGMIMEPSAAVVIAAVCTGRVAVAADTVLVVAGGNLDNDVLQRCLQSRTSDARDLEASHEPRLRRGSGPSARD